MWSDADIFCTLSDNIQEAFGTTPIEAMAAGLPVICYDYGGQTDFLSSDSTGYVVKLNDETAFLHACNTLINEPEARRRMGDYNQHAVEAFYIDNCAGQYEALYEETIDSYQLESAR